LKKNSFNEEVDKIITSQVNNIDIREDSYKPDENKFTDYLEFTEKYPDKSYLEFREFCQEKNKIKGGEK